jgi:hypothetical protein
MISSNLQSQIAPEYQIKNLLLSLGRKVTGKIRIEFWYVGVWTNYGIISYRNLAEWLRKNNEAKAKGLNIIQKGLIYFVEGKQQSLYAVLNGKCQCMKFICLRNRIQNECPNLFKAMGGKIDCHHTLAVEINSKAVVQGNNCFGGRYYSQ